MHHLVACLFVSAFLSAPKVPITAQDERHVDRSDAWMRSGVTILSGFRNMYHPTVLEVEDADYPYRMWFMGWAADDTNSAYHGCDAIFLARGKTLDRWEVYAGDDAWDVTQNPRLWVPVLLPQDKPYDAWHNGDPSIVLRDGTFYMAYSATGPDADGILYMQPGDTDGDLYCVMGATSSDGIHWQRTDAPLVIYEKDVGAPSDDANDATLHGMYHRPSLLYDEGRWRLWFDYWAGTSVAMGYAEADSFAGGAFRVLHAKDNPLLHEWPNPSVVKHGGTYHAFADPSGYGEGWAGRQIAEAVSNDGIHWRILGYLPPDADTPANHVPAASVLTRDGACWLTVFYACQVGGEPYDYRYNRLRYMQRPLESAPPR